jgi:hypothetical protein
VAAEDVGQGADDLAEGGAGALRDALAAKTARPASVQVRARGIDLYV